MRIGFDAKRAFRNRSGLGNYSRSTISLLSKYYPSNEYFLYTTDAAGNLFEPRPTHSIIQPEDFLSKTFKSVWRSFGISSLIQRDKLNIYHGLSNELPIGIQKTACKSVVSIHDLIFLRYPELYPFIDRQSYRIKFRYACDKSDRIIAISESTKNDIIDFLGIRPEKVDVVYQTCNQIFTQLLSPEIKENIRNKYQIPNEFILSVGTIEPRKNALTILKGMLSSDIRMPLLLVGKNTAYTKEVLDFAKQNGLSELLMIRNGVETIDLPAIYQSATVFAYPSIFEGFGIPILEALYSGTPVITSKGSCFPESGGEAAIYVDHTDAEEIGYAFNKVIHDSELRKKMISEGFLQASKFNEQKVAERLMNLYQEIAS